jgi:O-antigen ligase
MLAHDWQAHNAQPVSRWVFYYLMPLGLYWVARQARVFDRGVLAVNVVLGALGVYLAATALAEKQGLSWLVFPRYIASPEYPEFLGRGRGPLLNPIGTGFFMSVCLYALWACWARAGRFGKAVIAASAALIAAGLAATLTRSVWMGAGLGVMVIAAAALPRGWRMPVLGGSLILVAILGATQWERLLAFKRDRGMGAAEAAASVKLRPILARVAWNMFLDRPLFGCGFGHYKDESVNYLADRTTDLPLEAARPYVQHNAFLALLTETGLVGLTLWVAVLALWGRDAWRLWRSDSPLWARQQGLVLLAVLASYFMNAMFHDVSIIPMFHMLLFFAAGLAAGLYPVERGNSQHSIA